jgi:hypothetical protein
VREDKKGEGGGREMEDKRSEGGQKGGGRERDKSDERSEGERGIQRRIAFPHKNGMNDTFDVKRPSIFFCFHSNSNMGVRLIEASIRQMREARSKLDRLTLLIPMFNTFYVHYL